MNSSINGIFQDITEAILGSIPRIFSISRAKGFICFFVADVDELDVVVDFE